jgi:hypothetical protein
LLAAPSSFTSSIKFSNIVARICTLYIFYFIVCEKKTFQLCNVTTLHALVWDYAYMRARVCVCVCMNVSL